jgi:hypothetical protein
VNQRLNEIIDRFKEGVGVTDEELLKLLELRNVPIDLDGYTFALREIAYVVSNSERVAYNRFGSRWIAEHLYGADIKTRT